MRGKKSLLGVCPIQGELQIQVPAGQVDTSCPATYTCPPPVSSNVKVKVVLLPDCQLVTTGACPSQSHFIADHFVASPSVTKKFGPTGTLYRSVSPVRSRKIPNSGQSVTSSQPKLAKVSDSV